MTPFKPENCAGATIDLTLDTKIKKYISGEPIVLGKEITEDMYIEVDISKEDFYLQPSESVLIKSHEYFKVPVDKLAIIPERYSVKLTGLMISPASYMNPGYQGKLSFLAVNHSSVPIRLLPGIKFTQLAVAQLTSESDKPYGKQDAKYMGSVDVSISKLHLDNEIQEFLVSKGITNVSSDTARELGNHLVEMMKKSASKIADELREKLGDPS
ncbi:hypothetical protein PCURB6_16000 [Paenibacillus curdlanolyticus]|nr:hypothetical protein PCURB6_16000 [Paenibacillus curdlanolyticus]